MATSVAAGDIETLRGQLVALVDAARRAVIENMDRAGQRASGRTAASLAVDSAAGEGQLVVSLWGRSFFQGVETGRAGGRVPRGFMAIIRQWATDKGLSFGSERERNSFAFCVARKIAAEGTALYRRGGRSDIYTPVFERLAVEAQAAIDSFFGAAVEVAFNSIKLN